MATVPLGRAAADDGTGNSLYEQCTDDSNLFGSGACYGYIRGTLGFYTWWSERDHFCGFRLPAGTTVAQVKDVVVRFLADHPDERPLPSSALIVRALHAAFPCAPPATVSRDD